MRRVKNYELSASLVHKLMTTIIAAIIAIGGYMLGWAINDAAWKSAHDEKHEHLPPRWLQDDVEELKKQAHDHD